jgi:adenosylcobinamide-phosphate synthase
VHVDDATMGDGRRDAESADIVRALALYRRADAILLALFAAATVFVIAPR